MGTMTFLLPSDLPAEALHELERACVAGGPDSMPWPTRVRLNKGQLLVQRDVDESGCLAVPWEVNGSRRQVCSSATLMERDPPYRLEIELARGKVNQLRSQAWEWRTGGLHMPPTLDEHIRQATLALCHALMHGATEEGGQQAQLALNLAYQAADHLVQLYTDQVFHIRRQRHPRLETVLGCRLDAAPLPDAIANALLPACSGIVIPFSWSAIEPTEGSYQWSAPETMLDWAEAQGLAVTGGPLVDFSAVRLPDWLWLWERDLGSLARFTENYVANTVRRYRDRIRTWHLTAASNCASVLSLTEDELLWLTVRLAETIRQIDPELKIVIGIAQPWGEYMAQEDRTHSPFVFADTLVRSGLSLAALEIELVMGVTPRGSYCRDLLDISRLLDLYAILGVPLRVTLAYPAATGADPQGDPELRVGGGHWRGGFTPETQADWAGLVAALVACKPYVQAVHWAHATDSQPHQFPHCGLFDAAGQARPALQQLTQLRERHFR